MLRLLQPNFRICVKKTTINTSVQPTMLIKTVKGGLKCLSLPKHRQILGVQAVDQQGKASSPSAGSALGLGCGGKW